MPTKPLLSIAIPAYARPQELEFGLYRFIVQILGKYEDEVEIVVSDDNSPDDQLGFVRRIAERYRFVRYRRYPANIGLERNLTECADECTGEYLWIFGDDDFLEVADALDSVMEILRRGRYDCVILNRTRRSFDLTRLLSPNWMRLDPDRYVEFSGLRAFCLEQGFISVIGFISVNVFRREHFIRTDATKYRGTMYPQLGAMVEAFHSSPTLLVGRPLVCHRTQTAEEKKAALGTKAKESDFMSDIRRRNAIYFSHPYVAMLEELITRGAFTPDDIVRIPENTVINGLLIEFLIRSIGDNQELQLNASRSDWETTSRFFSKLPLSPEQRVKIDAILSKGMNSGSPDSLHQARLPGNPSAPDAPLELAALKGVSSASSPDDELTISVITPSYNQAEFLFECLASVKAQTVPALEHFVYDPGSSDNSREIAASFPHVTLIAESDNGQSDALNKGMLRARGGIIAWLNSDDYYANPEVFAQVVDRFRQADKPDLVYGTGTYVNEKGVSLRPVYINKDPSTFPWRFQHEDGILQPALFMRRSVVEKVGQLRGDLHFSMDYEFWIRCMKAGLKFAFLDLPFACARYHLRNKTYGQRGSSYEEVCSMMKEHFGYCNHVWLRRYAEFLVEGHDGVLATAKNDGVRDAAALDTTYRELLAAYNTDFDTYKGLLDRAGEKGPGDTLREMKTHSVAPPVPLHPIPIDRPVEPNHVCYTVAQRRWAFEAKWKRNEIDQSHQFLRDRIAARTKKVCVIVGNGPSLNHTNLELLRGNDVIISNNAFLSPTLAGVATYFTVVNYLVAEQSSHRINRLQGLSKVLPYWLAYCLNPGPNTHFVDAVGYPEFSKDIFKNMSWRHTVTFFNLHLAYGLGYRKVVMIGFDHSYKQSPGVAEQQIIQSYEEDVNHFDPSYFRGKKWQAADVDMMEAMYRLAKDAFEEDGREIVNATVGGRLELFRRESLQDALDTRNA